MEIFFNTGAYGYLYLISNIIFFGYLIYLSVVDIKHHMLEYWQTGGLFLFSILNMIANIAVKSYSYQHTYNEPFPFAKTIFLHLGSGAIIFVLMLLCSSIKRGGKNAFGGADIWALTAVAIPYGMRSLSTLVFSTCLSFLIYAMIYKIKNKKLPEKTAFLPFISCGTFIVFILLLL